MRTTLDTLRAGEQATVVEVNGLPDTVGRLMEMGVVAGTPLRLLKFAPLGDPMEIELRGYHLSLRQVEAAGIVVEKTS